MLDGGGVHFDLPPEPRPSHLASPRRRWSSGEDGGFRSGKRAGYRRLRSCLFQTGAYRILSWTLTAGELLFFVLCKNFVLVEILIEENFNLVVCQLLWFAVCSNPVPWPPGR